MPAIPLAAMARRARKTRKREAVFRPIIPASTMASDLYAAAYAPVVKGWGDAGEKIIAAYERALASITTDSPADVGATISAVDSELTRIILSIRLRIEQWAMKVEAWHRGKWRGAVLSATGVDLKTMLGAGAVRVPLGMAVERNVALVRSVSDQARGRISDAVFRGLSQRRPARDVAADIREAVAMSRRRSLGIASHQISMLTDQLAQERRREAGLSTWEWIHSGKVHARPEHVARNGKRYTDNDPPPDMPSELPGCGCASRAVLSLDSEF